MKNKKYIEVIIICLITAGISFWGGMVYAGKNITAANASRQGQFGQNGGGRGSGMRGGQNGNGGGFISGEILSKDDKSMTLKLRDGGSKIIFFSPTAKVEKTVDGSISDVVVGKSVMVTGTTNLDGSVSANSIQIRPSLPVPAPVKTN